MYSKNFSISNGSKRPRIESPEIVQPIFDRFFQIKLNNGSFKDVSPFVLHKSLEAFFGSLADTKKLSDGSLLIEVKNEKQSLLAVNFTKLHSYDVITIPHPNLNQIKGVISCSDLANCTDDEILENLRDQGVINVFRLPPNKKFPNQKSSTFILSFKTHSLPASIKAGWYNIRVRQHIPSPMRCFNCQKFGHLSVKCSFSPICPSCGHQAHGENPCSLPSTCSNCNEPHSPRYKGCAIYKKEFEIQKIRVTDKISYPEARRKYSSLNPTFSQSYSSVAAKKKISVATQCNFPPEPISIPPYPIPKSPNPSTSTSPLPSPTILNPPLTFYPSPNLTNPPMTPSLRRMDLTNIKKKPDITIPIKKIDPPGDKYKQISKLNSNKPPNKNNSKASKSSKESLSSDMDLDLSSPVDITKAKNTKKKP